MADTAKKLNLGCGTDIKPGWINLDAAALPGVDVVHDIARLPLPFPDETMDKILCQDILEHTDYVPILRDLHRILKTGEALTVRVPHFTSKHNFIDPTHRRLFSVNTFDFFVRDSSLKRERDYYFDFAFSRIASCRITFEHTSRFFVYNHAVSALVNRSRMAQMRYESTGFSRLFPAYNIVITLVK
jgi:ubiquinone/menaquinone biosynthesis C-methylase UbiE